MFPLALFLLAITVVLSIPWLISEFRGKRRSRITLGILAIAVTSVWIWGLSSVFSRFDYNAWYGGATGNLIHTSLEQIEDGNLERVLKIWRGLDRQYHPTYENRARYDKLVEEAVAQLRGDKPIEEKSAWDASVFTTETWLGHWEDGYGYWIVVNKIGDRFDIVQSGQPRSKVNSISVSSDFRTLKFKEGDRFLHTLTLKNKYEASYEWFDLQKKTISETRPVYKLIRATDEQKAMTQVRESAKSSQPVEPATNQTARD